MIVHVKHMYKYEYMYMHVRVGAKRLCIAFGAVPLRNVDQYLKMSFEIFLCSVLFLLAYIPTTTDDLRALNYNTL